MIVCSFPIKTHLLRREDSEVISLNSTLTPIFLNEFRIGVTKRYYVIDSPDPNRYAPTGLIIFAYPVGGMRGLLGISGGGESRTEIAPNGGREIYRTDWNNFAPNVGFNWDPTGAGKWSVSAIANSGAAMTTTGVDDSSPLPRSLEENKGLHFARAAGARNLSELRALPAETLSADAGALPAINRQHHSRDELRFVGSEEQGGESDIPRRPHLSAQRNALVPLTD